MYTRFLISTMHLMCLNDLISKTFNPCLSEVRSENSLVICQQPWFKHLKFDYFFCYVGTNTYLLCKLFEKNKCKSAHFYWASWWLSVKNHLPRQEKQIPSLSQEDPLEKKVSTHCLGNPMDRGARRATDHGVAKSHTWFSY